MKRYLMILLTFCLVFSLSACGGEATSVPAQLVPQDSPSVAPVETAQDGDYVIPTDWTENSAISEQWGYVTAGAELDSGTYEMDGAYLTTRLVEDESNVLLRLTTDGTEVDRIVVPQPALSSGDDWSVGYYYYNEDSLWFVENYFALINEETNEMASSYTLKKWSLEGEELLSLPMEETYGINDSNFLCGLGQDPEGNPLILTMSGILFCDEMGNVVAEHEMADANALCFVRDKEDRVYCYHIFDNALYTMDWENHALGKPVLELDINVTVMTGGGEYDLLLCGETSIKGVSFSDGTVTELLSLTDLDLAGMVAGVSVMDDGNYLVAVHDILLGTSQVLTLRKVPTDEIPEKTAVTLAVGMDQATKEWGGTWADALDQKVTSQIANFNRSSETYRVEVVTYSSAQELQLMLNSGDAPDVIAWNSTAWLEEPPSLEIYANRGYLTDLRPLFEQDGMYSDFIPSIVSLVEERTGGIHAMPVSFYLASMAAPIDYVGDKTGWTYGEMLAVAKQMPEDMCLWSGTSGIEAMRSMLYDNMDAFVDVKKAECDFTNQEFYDLLTICRDYFPLSIDETYSEPSGGSLITQPAVIGRFGQFASDVLRNMKTGGTTFIGYPGDEGNGFTAIFNNEFSLCALGDQQDGAWEFLKTVYDYEYQYAAAGMFTSVRSDVFHDREDWYLEVNGSCTEEESMEARALVDGVKTLRNYNSPAMSIILEEAQAYFTGDKSAEAVAEIIENRVKIYLSEQN